MSKTELKVDWCSYAAVRYACIHWHYSRSVPAGKLVKVGVWEQGRFIGCVLFGRGASPYIASPFELKQTEVCELVRVALDKHKTPVSRIIAIAVKLLKKQSPGLRLIISYADEGQGHLGSIYQAGNWLYLGAAEYHIYRVRGRRVHAKTLYSRYGKGGQSIPWLRAHVDPNAERLVCPPKHKYAMPLDRAIRERLIREAKPYPKRAGSVEGGTSCGQQEGGGSIPTPALSDGISADG